MTHAADTPLADQAARDGALDTSRSILVQAPAGSGKTELLTMRFLKLLAEVEEPQQVLAITFTRPATAEMRHRILKRLGEAKAADTGALPADEAATLPIARAALDNSDKRGWRLLEQPQRLNIQTIDSLCLRIAHQMPLKARLGGTLQPTENAQPLYRKAARNTFDRLGGDDVELNEALAALLSLRDSNLKDCETLLAEMLATRDQWARTFLLSGDVDWPEVRTRLEESFRRENERVLQRSHQLLSSRPKATDELLELASYACESAELVSDIRELAGSTSLPQPASQRHWVCIANFLLKKTEDDWLLNVNKSHGFPTSKDKNSREVLQKERRKRLVADLQATDGLLNMLCEIRRLPPPHYTADQWTTLRQMFAALRQAVHELRSVFSDENSVDFVEIGMSALQVLGGSAAESDGNEHGQQIRHLLVDEFQDTSRRQHELIAALLRDWRTGDGRTFFLVGDPMQSIYMFRQADVELFKQVDESGFATASQTLPVKTLQLTTNFRSNAGVVAPLNEIFNIVFPHGASDGAASVAFLPGIAKDQEKPASAFNVHKNFVDAPKKTRGPARQMAPGPTPESVARRAETDDVVDIIRGHLAKVDMARESKQEFTIAVLGRSKAHLAAVAAALRTEEVPFRAVELEELGERQEVIDLQSLTRALLHPMDRIAWLSLLRAPWCGLNLGDIHTLCGTDRSGTVRLGVRQQIASTLHLLGDDSKRRVTHLLSVLEAAQRSRRIQSSFSSWIERSWHSLGGPACVDAAGYENALAYFLMLQRVAPDGIAATGEPMEDALKRLFAMPDPAASERCGVQLMTIHKAKGLGFNVVILPGLDRKGGQDTPPLVRYLERAKGTGTEMLVAPINAKGEQQSTLYNWVQRQKYLREAEEQKRLLYVACTRARDELHLFANATVGTHDVRSEHGSLLRTAWPALKNLFQQAYAEQTGEKDHSLQDNLLPFPTAQPQRQPISGVLDLAASGAASSLRRLPSDWISGAAEANVTLPATISPPRRAGSPSEGRRTEGAMAARTLGNVVHALFERATQLLASGLSAQDLRSMLPVFHRQATALVRNSGLSPQEVDSCTRRSLSALESALGDPSGEWILKPHPQATIERSWTGLLNGTLETRRIDRSFLAGPEAISEGNDHLWIIDYKTATHRGPELEIFLEAERLQYQEQLEKYGELMGLVYGKDVRLRLGLYYPLLKRLVSWPG